MFRKHICGFRFRAFAAAASIVLTSLAGNLSAGALTYGLNNVRYFPSGGGTVSDTTGGTLTAATANSHTTSFSTNPGDPAANTFDGVDTVTGSPFGMTVMNSVTIGTAATSSSFNWLSFAVAYINETGVTVTGGSGTAYLLPTFRFQGSFNVANPSLYSTLDTCDGNSSCDVASPAFSLGGSQNIDLLYTPVIDSSTSFQFGTPFPIHYGVDAFIGYQGTQANPGAATIAGFSMKLVSIQVVDASGSIIPGAQINSQFVDLAIPEPGSGALAAVGILLAAVRLVRNKTVGIGEEASR